MECDGSGLVQVIFFVCAQYSFILLLLQSNSDCSLIRRQNLQKLPQLSAIHHNNCMYIAHHLLTLGHQFRYHLPSPLSDGAATFVDMVPGYRRLGGRYL